MSLIRGFWVAALFSACATSPIPAPPSGWLTEGPEAEVVLERRLLISGDDPNGRVETEFLERQLIRRGKTTTIIMPIHPDRRVRFVAAEIRRHGAPVIHLGKADFVPVDRHRAPVPRARDAAYLAARIEVPSGGLVTLHWKAEDRHAGLLPRLVLTGPAPVRKARIEVTGGLVGKAQLTATSLAGGVLRSPDKLIGTWTNLSPAVSHPFAPGELAMRGAWLEFPDSKPPRIIDLLLNRPEANFQIAAVPLVSSAKAGEPCLLRPWGAKTIRPETTLLTTAAQRPEGGYEIQLPDAYRRRFADCTLVAPGQAARLPVTQPRGERLLRMRSVVSAEGNIETKGRLVYIGAAASAVRRGGIEMREELAQLLSPFHKSLVVNGEQRSGAGITQLEFSFQHRAPHLDPSAWLGDALPELAFLPRGQAMAPLVAHRRVEWTFVATSGRSPPPATHTASVTHGRIAASSAWSLGPQQTLRFVRSVDWTPIPSLIDGASLRQQLLGMRVTPAPLPVP